MRHPTIHGITTSNTIRRTRKDVYRHKNGDICNDKKCISHECVKTGIMWGFSNRKSNSKIQGFSNVSRIRNKINNQIFNKNIQDDNYEDEIFYSDNEDDYSNEVFSSEPEFSYETEFYDEIPEEILQDTYLEENEYEKLLNDWILIDNDQSINKNDFYYILSSILHNISKWESI